MNSIDNDVIEVYDVNFRLGAKIIIIIISRIRTTELVSKL